MRILLVSMYYYPEPHSIPHDLAVELRDRGHTVEVITGFPNYPSGKIYDGYRIRHWQWESIEGIRVLRLPFYINRSKSALPRILSYLSFTILAAILGFIKVKRPDVIWTYQVGLPGVLLSTLKRAPLIHEVQDLWPEWGVSSTSGMRKQLFQLLDFQERLIYRHARAIVTISNGFRRVLIDKNVPDKKINVIPNWANEQNFHPAPRDPELGRIEQFTGTFNLVYLGNIGTAQGLDVVVSAAEQLRNMHDIRFIIIGDGVERERLAGQAANKGLSSVRFLGSRPQEKASEYLAWADVVLIHLKDEPIYAITIPSKTYGYLACGRPILAAASGNVANLVTELGAGIICPPENPEALAEAVRHFYSLPVEERERMGKAGQEAFQTQFTRHILGNRYDMLFRNVI